jgi:hypothetical protein
VRNVNEWCGSFVQKNRHLYLQMLGSGYVSELNIKERIRTMEIGTIRKL